MAFPLWGVVLIIVLAAVVIPSGVIFGVMYQPFQTQQQQFFQSEGSTIQSFITASVEQLLSDLEGDALSVYYSEPLIMNCSMPGSTYNPDRLIRLSDSLSTNPNIELESLGFMMRAPNQAKYPIGKVSWEIAPGFGCPKYIYAYADPDIYPDFVGYCASTNGLVNYSDLDYNASDWGLKPQEQWLLNGSNTDVNAVIHLPIFPLLGYLTLTVERAVSCDGVNVYGAVFAELSLAELSTALASVTEAGVVAFVVEADTGYLVASSIANQTQGAMMVGGALTAVRISAASAPSTDIQAIYSTNSDDWSIGTVPIQLNDINWVLYYGVPKGSYLASLKQINIVSISVFVAVIVATMLLAGLVVYFRVTKPLQRISNYLNNPKGGYDPIGSGFSEVNDVQDALRRKAVKV